ncbi:polysaccharide pyruvyl transferase family protein [Mesorhizobium ephedrae]|jgi:hypothetical protein|uniref:Polysaccharide pyruvyl transferase n=1 Tax=Kumtagia ephedrae TaxID=2116701 RepID=A0A2P7S8H1_9HYPH|nr:polysaccharide pyruvyl transferase [Mesorhizobium ephedrae]
MPASRKIGVLTFHRCINYGSYWQARCLVEGLRSMGHDAVLLDHHSPLVNRREWRCALRPQVDIPGDTVGYVLKTRLFFEAFDRLPCSARFDLDDPSALAQFDRIVVGSDEVWNLRHPWYGGHSIFYGVGLEPCRLVSYAASFGNYDAAEGLPSPWTDRLATFRRISVRDGNSARIVRDALGSNPELVLDPCLQFPPAAEPVAADTPYVAVYGHSFPRWFTAMVRTWAISMGYRLLSIGYRNAWADEQRIAAGPETFARLMAGAAAVVTNFFHGCVFSLFNAKPFACVSSDYRANKLRDLTQLLGAGNHLVDEHSAGASIAGLLGAPLEGGILSRIEKLRRRSHDYLREALA